MGTGCLPSSCQSLSQRVEGIPALYTPVCCAHPLACVTSILCLLYCGLSSLEGGAMASFYRLGNREDGVGVGSSIYVSVCKYVCVRTLSRLVISDCL